MRQKATKKKEETLCIPRYFVPFLHPHCFFFVFTATTIANRKDHFRLGNLRKREHVRHKVFFPLLMNFKSIQT